MSLDLGQLVIELVGDYSQLQADIEEAKRYALKQAVELEKSFKITPTLDARTLLANAEITGKALGRGIEKSLSSYKFSNTLFKAAGEAIASGLSAGMKSGDSQVKAASSRMAGLVIDETRQKLKIHSPSKVFEEIGGEIVAGLSAGIGAGGALSISGFIQGIINDAKSALGAGLAFAGDSINKYSDFKATEAQLESLTGNTAKTIESLKFLRTEADKLALPFLDSTKAYASLVAATNNTKLAPLTKDIFDGFSSGSRAAQLSTADFNGAFLGLVQSITKGKETTQDFRQISDRIPQAMGVAAKSIGVTNEEFKKLLESGDLASSVFIPAFTKALGEASTTTLATATDTSTASLTRLNNRLDEVKVSLGQAIEPGVVAGLDFALTALNELGKAGLFDDLNAGAKEFAAYLKDNPQYAKATAETIRGVLKDAIANTVTLAQQLGNYLKQNPTAIKDAATTLVGFGKGISDAVSFAQNLLGIFQNIAKTVDEAYEKASKLLGGDNQSQSRFKQFLHFGPASLIPGFNLGGDSTTPGQTTTGIVKGQGLRIIDSNDLKPIRQYSDITRHHANRGFESDRGYDEVGGRQEEIRRLKNGLELVKKDIVLENANGSTDNVMVPAPVSGYARTSKDYGKFALYDKPTGGNLLGQVLHLDPSSFQFKDGDYVNYGQSIGRQAGTGAGGKLNAYGTHAHIELVIEQWRKYIQDLQTGIFNATSQATKPTLMQLKKNINLSASDGWMRTMASTYGANDGTDGGPTASGRTFHANELTAAINENLKKNLGVKWGDKVEALNQKTGKSVIVTITDSGPYEKRDGKFVPHSTRGFDLSTAAANQIGISLGEISFRVVGKNAQSQAIAQAQAPTTTTTTATGTQPPEIRAILEGQKLKDAAERRQKLRAAAQATMQSTRSLEDLDYSTIKNPSLSDRQAEEERKLQQKYDDEIKSASQRREDAQSRIGINSARLSSGSVPDAEAKDLQLQIALDKRSVTELDSVIQRLGTSSANAAKQLAQFQQEQRNVRARGVDFDSRSVDNSILSNRIIGLKSLETLSPTDTRLDSLPSLERELALKTTQLDLDRKLADVSDRENKQDITSAEASARVLQLQKENDLLVANINAQYQAAEAARTLGRAKLELNFLVRDNSSKSEFLKQDAQLLSYSIGTGDRLSMERDSNGLELETKYAQDKVNLLERSKLEGLTQTNGEKLRLALRFNQSKILNNEQFKRSVKDESVSNNRYVQQTGIDLLSARSDSLQGVGLDYSSKAIQKQIAVLNQNLSFTSAIAELQKLKETTNLTADQFIAAKANLEAINDIKLDSINSQFSDFSETIKGIQTDTQNVFKDLILNTQDFGDSLKKVLQDLLSNLANMASQQLSNQLFSGLLGGKANKNWQDNNSNGFGSIVNSIGGLFGGSSGADYSSFLDGGSSTDSFSFLGGFANGGMVGDIAKAMKHEQAVSGFKPHLIVANDGERILNPAETQMWNRLQNAGRLPNYADGGMIGGGDVSSALNRSNAAAVNVGGVHVTIASSEASNYDIPIMKRIIDARVAEGIKLARRPGGQISKGAPYDR